MIIEETDVNRGSETQHLFTQVKPKIEQFFHYQRKLALIITCSDYTALRKVMKDNAQKRIEKLKLKIDKVLNESIQSEEEVQ